jgi:sugar phosphate isomerase/epimerase
MRIGIFAKTFSQTDPLTVMRAAKAAGYDAVQYNLACSGLEPVPLSVPPGVAEAVAKAGRETGIAVAALSGTVNIAHPDPGHRADAVARLLCVIRVAPLMGAPMVTLCTGSRDVADQWRAHPDNATPAAWADMRAAMEQACALAEDLDVRLGIEPELGNVVIDAAAARRLIDELQSPATAIVLDPANLFEVSENRGDIIARAIDLLADRIMMVHAKDRDGAGGFVSAGTGVIDFTDFVARLRAAGFAGDLVTHGLTADEAPSVARFLRGVAG